MTQGTLFDDERPAKIARDSDPETSHTAAAELLPKLGRLEARLLSAFRMFNGAPATAREAAEFAYRHHRCEPGEHTEADTYRKRYTGLLKKDRIEAAGTKVCRVTGKNVTAYTLKESK